MSVVRTLFLQNDGSSYLASCRWNFARQGNNIAARGSSYGTDRARNRLDLEKMGGLAEPGRHP
jgi:hypothetical protein